MKKQIFNIVIAVILVVLFGYALILQERERQVAPKKIMQVAKDSLNKQ
jgi:hypothetical protein